MSLEKDLSWIKTRLEYLRNWRKYLRIIYTCLKELDPHAKAYLIGSLVENRHTVLSDVDVLIITNKIMDNDSRVRFKCNLLWKAFEKGLPKDYPIELHIVRPDEASKYFTRVKYAIPLETIYEDSRSYSNNSNAKSPSLSF